MGSVIDCPKHGIATAIVSLGPSSLGHEVDAKCEQCEREKQSRSKGEKLEEGWYWVRFSDVPGGWWPAFISKHSGHAYRGDRYKVGPRIHPPADKEE